MKKALLRALPLTVRIDSALRERGHDPLYDFETEEPSDSFFFDDGSALRSLRISSRFQEIDPADVTESLESSGYFLPREKTMFAVLPESEGGVQLYWTAEKTPLERWFGGSGQSLQELLPATTPTSVSEAVQTEEPAQEQPAAEAPLVQMHTWHGVEYTVAGHLRGGVFRKSYLLQRSDRLCFAMMTGPRPVVTQLHQGFVDFLKSVEDWPTGHRSHAMQTNPALGTLTLVIDSSAHCRFFCAGIQPLYWSGRLRKLMRFPNTENPLNSRLHEGDAVLLIPGAWTAREAAELREIFLYKENLAERISTFLDYAGRGRGILIRRAAEAP